MKRCRDIKGGWDAVDPAAATFEGVKKLFARYEVSAEASPLGGGGWGG